MSKLDKKKEKMGLLKLLLVILISLIVGIFSFVISELKNGNLTILSFIGVIAIGVFSILLVLLYFKILDTLDEIEKL